MPKFKLIIGCLIWLTAVYADSGLYVGVGAGMGSINSTAANGYQFGDGSSSKFSSNMAGDAYLGYDLNHYIGIQSDYYYIANVSYPTVNDPQFGSQSSTTANQQVADLGLVGHLPFVLFSNSLSGLSLFGKLAIGYSTINFNGGTMASHGTAGTNYQPLPGFANNLVPVAGAGVEYGWGSVGLRAEYTYIGDSSVANSNQQLMDVSNSLWLMSVIFHF